LQKVSQDVSTSLIAKGDFQAAHKSLPREFREVYAMPKIRDQVKAIGPNNVKAMIEYELAILASRMVTGGNLTDDLVDFVSAQLMEMFPTESIADIKLCFERGSMGKYGDIQRMDGVTIGGWMAMYLDEKYDQAERELAKQKSHDDDARGAKKPIEGLEQVYKQMADESNKNYETRTLKSEELSKIFKRSAPVDISAQIKKRDEDFIKQQEQQSKQP